MLLKPKSILESSGKAAIGSLTWRVTLPMSIVEVCAILTVRDLLNLNLV